MFSLRNKRILILSPQSWEGLHMSKHHLAQALAERGNTVVYLDPPRPDVAGITLAQHGVITVATYNHWLRGANKLPRALHMWYYRRLIRRVAQASGGPFDVLWCFDTSRMKWFPKEMGYPLLHLADIDIVDEGKELLKGASLILCVSDDIRTKALEFKPHAPVMDVGHALDQRWAEFPKKDSSSTDDRPRIVAYAGQMQWDQVDWDALLSITKAHRELDFHFYGPYRKDHPNPAFAAVYELPNTNFHGILEKSQLIPALHHADILLLSYRDQRSKDQNTKLPKLFPHKLLEYLATGNVIVSSHVSAYTEREDLLTMAPAGENIVRQFEKAIDQYALLNTETVRAARIAFAKEHGFPELLDRIEKLIGND